MNRATMDAIIEDRISKIKSTLLSKNHEYANDDDVFHNFRTAGAINNCSMVQALWGMFIKHFVWVRDMVLSGETPTQRGVIDEKIGDCIVYLAILEAMWVEALDGAEDLSKKMYNDIIASWRGENENG